MKEQSNKMGFFSLFAMGLGYVIGSGIFAMLPIAMGMTGKSVSLACMVGALMCLFSNCIPAMFLSSTVNLSGGTYSMGAALLPKTLAGAYGILGILGQITFAGSIISLTEYLVQLIPGLSDLQTVVSFLLLVGFFLLGIKGVKLSAGFQNATVVILLLSLATFIVGGLPRVNFSTYFNENYFAGGPSGFMTASVLMVFCSLGGTAVLSFTTEAKNPERNIPLAIFLSTLAVAVIYFLMGIVASGILPVGDVAAAMNLGVVAETFMSKPLYMFFMIGGAMFGLGTTVNAMLASLPYPVIKMAEDGWLPIACAKRDNRYNYPWIIMGVTFVIGGILPIVFGLDISQIATMAGAPMFLFGGILAFAAMRIPKLYPDRWQKSMFHIPNAVLYVLMAVCGAISFYLGVMMVMMNGTSVAIGIVVLILAIIVYCYWRVKSGKVDTSIEFDQSSAK